MNKPTSVKIFGQKYKIKYDYKEEDSYGESDPATNTINIRANLPEDKRVRVLMHEITHAILFESPLCDRKRFEVEEVCDIVGYQVTDMLKDNPHILEFIMREIVDEG